VENSPFGTWIHHTQGTVSNCVSPYRALNEVTKLEPGKPDQFCLMLTGLGDGSAVSVATFSVAWRIEMAHDKKYRGCEYVR
jgi:hypothetical protein